MLPVSMPLLHSGPNQPRTLTHLCHQCTYTSSATSGFVQPLNGLGSQLTDHLRRLLFSSFSSFASELIDLGLGSCAAFFIARLPPHGCSKPLNRVEAGGPFAWTSRLQALGPRLRKSCVPHVGYAKRRAHAPRSAASSWSARREASVASQRGVMQHAPGEANRPPGGAL